MAGRTLGREMEGLGVQGGIHSKGGRVGTRKAEEWEEQETNPKSPFPQVPSAHIHPHPRFSPHLLHPHSPTISAPMNRLRRTLTSQNQRCRNRHPGQAW